MLNYSQSQIERAKTRYQNFVRQHTLADYDVATIGINEATKRMEHHNSIVANIIAGDKETIREWKLFFLNDEFAKDAKKQERKDKLAKNQEGSKPAKQIIKKAGAKLGDYYKWLNQKGNKFRSEYFRKDFSIESAECYLQTL